MKPHISQMYIDEQSRETPLAARIISHYQDANIEYVPAIEAGRFARNRGSSRATTLCIARNNGRFIKPFPTHPWYHEDPAGACGHNLLIGYNCSAACRYCFTRTYFDHPYPTLFSNIDEMLDDLAAFLSEHPDGRISTGEFTDSFFLDDITRTNDRIFELMSAFPRATLELRTKSAMVDHLPANLHPGIVAAWSINPRSVIQSIEGGTAGFDQRLAAARALKEKGYRIALRIDPVIMAEAYLREYRGLADEIERGFSWRDVSELFLGAIRFDKQMVGSLAGNKSSEELLDAQHILCPDGKYRPHKYVRIEFYTAIIEEVRRRAPDLPIHLSMEPAYIHKTVLGKSQTQ